MKKNKLQILVPFTLLLLVLLAWSYTDISVQRRQNADSDVRLTMDGHSYQESIRLWQNGEQSEYWFFLPAFAQTDALRLDSGVHPGIEIDGQFCPSGELLPELTLDTPHTIRFGQNEGQLTIMQTDPMPAMYISTRTGDTERLHEHKGAKEEVKLTFLDTDGSLIYEQERFRDKIKVRGNTSSNLAKKPYTLTLDKAADLMDCGEAVKWVLIANATESTNLRNKIVYDFACEMGLPYSPHCEFISVYINGIYKGLYLLSEKTEVAPNRVELETDRGYLIAANQATKWGDMSKGFLTRYHEFEIVKKKTLEPLIRDNIAARFRQIEALIMEENEAELLPLIDVDSWARRYLMDEVFLEPDAEKASTYYYWHDLKNGPLYAGPIWDYDYALSTKGRYRDSHGLLIGNPDEYPWYAAMMQMPEFHQRVQELYMSEFLPLTREYAEARISELYSSVRRTVWANKMLWEADCPRLQPDPDSEVQQLQGFLLDRLDFIADYLEHPEDYRFVNFYQAEEFFNMSYTLKRGEALGGNVNDWVLSPELYENWYYENSDEIFDADRPVEEDQLIVPRLKPEAKAGYTAEKVVKYIPVMIVLALFGSGGLVLFVRVVQQLIQEGGRRKPWEK